MSSIHRVSRSLYIQSDCFYDSTELVREYCQPRIFTGYFPFHSFHFTLINCLFHLQLNQGQGQSFVKAMDNYGLGAAATFTGSTDSRVVQTKNLAMRLDRANNNSPV